MLAATTGDAVAPGEHEGQDPEGAGPSTLPYDPGVEGSEVAAGTTDVELGARATQEQSLGSLASVAAGLIASVLLGVVVWVQAQVRRHDAAPG